MLKIKYLISSYLIIDEYKKIVLKQAENCRTEEIKLTLTFEELQNFAEQMLLQATIMNSAVNSKEVIAIFDSLKLPVSSFVTVNGQKIAVADPEFLGTHSIWIHEGIRTENLLICNTQGVRFVKN